MRVRSENGGLAAMAVAGTYVVLLGWDMPEAAMLAQGVLGFAVRRLRERDGERIWLSGMKTFEQVEPYPVPGEPVTSFLHPLQTFQWADYSASPDERYVYTIVAMSGSPGALVRGPEVDLAVATERVDQGRHAVFFNRGAVASQEYARRFQNRRPDDVGPSAFNWLSRGLVEGLENFIAQAAAGDELLGAFFEFKSPRIYAALKAAKARGAAVSVLYDGDSQGEGNERALEGQGMDGMVKSREHSGGFAHNKFLVLRQAGVPKQVWTGSTNLSVNGMFGHSNNAHIVRDDAIAARYHQYWLLLDRDETRKPTATKDETLSPLPADGSPLDALFSPRLGLEALDWYAGLAAGAQRGVFMTFAFGMNSRFVPSYDTTDGVLRFALMEKKGTGKTYQAQAAEIDRIRRHPNVTVAVGHRIELNLFDRWLAELDRIADEAHVLYVHTKYMLVDPLGDTPTVVVGSANFSAASTTDNDENMLVIRGDTAVADVYLGEFMRLFSHYAFRESLQFKDATSPANALLRKYLVPSPAWIHGGGGAGASYFKAGSDRALRRAYFSGQ
jgi:phosphatidylserine/phosphatidylglycerophosphate/cardiolipin synthase-like enzyme